MMDLEALLRAAHDGQPGAWPRLLDGLYAELRGYFRRFFPKEDPNDLTQVAILIIWEKLEGFEASYSYTTWVRGIARYVALNTLRERYRWQIERFVDAHQAHLVASKGPSTALRWAELQDILRDELQHIPEYFRVVIEQDFAGTEVEVLAAQLGISPNTVRSRRRRGTVRVSDRIHARCRTPSRPRVSKLTSSAAP